MTAQGSAQLGIETPHGLARVTVSRPPSATPRAWLALGHGAGGGVDAADLSAAAEVALEEKLAVALIEQPYRVRGRRSPAPARQLDAAWIVVIQALRENMGAEGLPLITGGRSSGARVACRTAPDTAVQGVLCLAYPTWSPARGSGPRRSRIDELDGVGVPVLVVQGRSDPFGIPPPGARRQVVKLAGDHRLRGDLPGLRLSVRAWLRQVTSVGSDAES